MSEFVSNILCIRECVHMCMYVLVCTVELLQNFPICVRNKQFRDMSSIRFVKVLVYLVDISCYHLCYTYLFKLHPRLEDPTCLL